MRSIDRDSKGGAALLAFEDSPIRGGREPGLQARPWRDRKANPTLSFQSAYGARNLMGQCSSIDSPPFPRSLLGLVRFSPPA